MPWDNNAKQHRIYDEQERAAIDVFKSKYLEATTSACRKTIAQLDIFPALFNYWKSKGLVYANEDLKVKSNVGSNHID